MQTMDASGANNRCVWGKEWVRVGQTMGGCGANNECKQWYKIKNK